jgi:hypothetical protein
MSQITLNWHAGAMELEIMLKNNNDVKDAFAEYAARVEIEGAFLSMLYRLKLFDVYIIERHKRMNMDAKWIVDRAKR